MKKIDLGQTIGILANVGVIGGLIFVGLQLKQDRELASIERRAALAESRKYWAELVTANSEVWTKGLTGQQLTQPEQIEFRALAEALDMQLWQSWANSQSGAFTVTPDLDLSELQHSFIRQAAREYSSNPGLLEWYRQYQAQLREYGQAGRFEDLVLEEIDRLLRERSQE